MGLALATAVLFWLRDSAPGSAPRRAVFLFGSALVIQCAFQAAAAFAPGTFG